MSGDVVRDAPLEELVTGLAQSEPGGGSAEAVEIVRRFEPLLRRAFQRGGFAMDYEEFVQEVFVELFSGLPALRDVRAFPGYFRRVALSVAGGVARRRREGRDEAVEPPREPWANELFTQVAIRSLLERLTPHEREVISALFLEGFTPAELARRLGIEPGSVRMAKSRSLARLRQLLEADSRALDPEREAT